MKKTKRSLAFLLTTALLTSLMVFSVSASQSTYAERYYATSDTSAIQYHGNWKKILTSTGGFYMASNTQGDSCTFTFYGTSAKFVSFFGVNGDCLIQIDDQAPTKHNLYKPNSASDFEFETGNLALGYHTIKITVANDPNSSVKREIPISYFETTTASSYYQLGRFYGHSGSPAIQYYGNWEIAHHTFYDPYGDSGYGGYYLTSDTEGDSIVFTFYGTKASLASYYAWNGNCLIQVDNQEPTEHNLGSTWSRAQEEVIYQTEDLPIGYHTIKVTVLDNGKVPISYFEINSSTGKTYNAQYSDDNYRVLYSGNWQKTLIPYNGQDEYMTSYTSGNTCTFNFYGNGVKFMSPALGEFLVQIDNQEPVVIYSSGGEILSYSSDILGIEMGNLPIGEHTIKITVIGANLPIGYFETY